MKVSTKVRFVNTVERVLLLKQVEELRDLSPRELAWLAQYAHERSFSRGSPIFRQGERVESCHIILEGGLQVRGGEHGDGTLGPPHMLGLLSMLARSEEGLEAVAEADTLTLEIGLDLLEDVFEDHFDTLNAQIRRLACEIMQHRMRIPHGTTLAPGAGKMPDVTHGLGLIERLMYMRRSNFFKPGNMDAWVEIASRSSEARFGAGVRLWEKGDAAEFTYIIIEGTVRALLDGERHYFRAGPGYPLGNVESQCGRRRWYEARTETPVVALKGETDVFIDVLEDHFEMAMEFVASMARGLISLRQTGG